MSVYLTDIPLAEAQSCLLAALKAARLDCILGIETIPLDEQALGRVLAEPAWARLSSPHYHASAMDGFALRAEDTRGAQPSAPVTLAVNEQTVYVDTGDPLPDWANAVIPIELVESLDDLTQIAADVRQPHNIRIRAAVTPWSHVRPMGEDIVATQLVLPAGQVLRPVDLGALAAGGFTELRVSRHPRVAVIPTGTELIPIGAPIKSGDIIEYNAVVLSAQVNAWGGEAHRFPIIPDDFSLICQQVQQAADTSDLVLLNAGSSAGSEDYSARVIEQLGSVLVHGVAVRPGHPVIFGMVKHTHGSGQTPIIGVPGYPVSAALTGEIFVEPLLALWTGRQPLQPQVVEAQLTRKLTSPAGDDDFVRVVAGRVGDRLLAAPLTRGAGVITSLVRADGIAILPRGVQGLDAGSPVQVRLYRSSAELDRTIFAIGSHDLTLDLLAQYLSERRRRLVSANVGSQGGLVALRRGEAHLAGSHLLDPVTGQYNLTAIREYLPETPVRVIAWVDRTQGLLVRRGNPLHITTLSDLTRPDVRFVNRQHGAGTRILLDYHLTQLGVTSDQVHGYQQEEYTHLAVAAAVASGRADCGLGIAAAAQALDLDFIPLYQEQYDLVIPVAHLAGPLLSPILELMADSRFRQTVAALAGYQVERMGAIVLDQS